MGTPMCVVMQFSEAEFEEFKTEAFELLDAAEKSLLALDQGADFKVEYDSIFRSFHSVKGAAGMLELVKLQAHTHRLESLLVSLKSQDQMSKAHIGLFLKGLDATRALLHGEDIELNYDVASDSGSQAAVPKEALDEFSQECDDLIEAISKDLQRMESDPFEKSVVDRLYRSFHTLKSSSQLFGFSAVGDIAHRSESSLESVRSGAAEYSQVLSAELFGALKAIELGLSSVRNATPSSRKPERGAVEAVTAKTEDASSSIRVPVALLDSLMTMMGEMVLVRNQVIQYSSRSRDREFLDMSKRLNLVTSDIQAGMMKTRIQPIGNVLSKFTRVVRDLSAELGKKITIQIEGSETELDKSLLEAVKDPLMHIVRNSCDHGIEMPQIRRDAGKSETGMIRVRSYHEGGHVIVEVTDDGKGLRKDALLKKAVEKGLLRAEDVENIEEKDVLNLIFAPGFSTAAKVTNVSGRGVGMDVVRTNIEKIGGSVELSSREGQGTTTRIKIPLTVAIVPVLIVKSGPGTFAIPQVKLEELIRIETSVASEKIELLHGAPVYRLRGEILPLVDLRAVLDSNFKANASTYVEGTFTVAVLNTEQSTFGLIVEQVRDSVDIVVKPLNGLLKSLQIYSGATVLGDGSIALILDVPGLAKRSQLDRQRSAAREKMEKEREALRQRAEQQDYLVVQLASSTRYAFVLGSVHRLEEFKETEIERSGLQAVVRYRDRVLPLIDVNEALGFSSSGKNGKISVVVIKKAEVLYGLVVDRVLDTVSSESPMDPVQFKMPGVFGNLVTPRELLVILNPFEIIESAIQLALPQPVQQGRILLVEDTPFFRRAIRGVLEESGFTVVSANDGQDALEILMADSRFDLVVSDIEMPRMNGLRFAEAVRNEAGLAALPLLAISARADSGSVSEGAKAGFDLYLEKLKPENLLEAISQLLKKERAA